MEAKGLHHSFVNKMLQEKYERVSKTVVEEMDSQSEARQVHPNKNHITTADINKPENLSRGKKEKAPLIQHLPMTEFFELKHRGREKKRKGLESDLEMSQTQKGQAQPQNLTNSQKNQEKGNSVQVHGIPQKIPLQKNQPKDNLNQQPKKIQKVFCAPGSLSKYTNMRRTQELSGLEKHDGQMNHSKEARGSSAREFNSYQPVDASDEDLGAQQTASEINQNHSNEVLDFVEEDTSDDVEDAISHENEILNTMDLPLEAENENTVVEKKKHRGKTVLKRVQTRTMEERDTIIFNNLLQPVGPTRAVINDFTHLLGVYARDPVMLPMNFISWKYVPQARKNDVWENVKKKFIVHEHAKKWVLNNINRKWTVEKARVKAKHYYQVPTYEERLAHRPKNIPIEDFKELLRFWDSPKSKEISDISKGNRDKQGDMHTLGPKSLAVLRHELQEKHPDKKPPTQADVFMESRKRTVGRTYLTNNDETQKNIEKMNALQALNDASSEKDPNYDPYPDVITKKEHPGRLRLQGAGVTKSKLKTRDVKTPYVVPPIFLESITEQVEKKLSKQMDQHISSFLSKIREAKPGINLVIPDFSTNQVVPPPSENLDGDAGDNN